MSIFSYAPILKDENLQFGLLVLAWLYVVLQEDKNPFQMSSEQEKSVTVGKVHGIILEYVVVTLAVVT